jgi:hypothetical protein
MAKTRQSIHFNENENDETIKPSVEASKPEANGKKPVARLNIIFYSICMLICLPLFLDSVLPSNYKKEIVVKKYTTTSYSRSGTVLTQYIKTTGSTINLTIFGSDDAYSNISKNDTIKVEKSFLWNEPLSFESGSEKSYITNFKYIFSRIAFFFTVLGMMFFSRPSGFARFYLILTTLVTAVFLVILFNN